MGYVGIPCAALLAEVDGFDVTGLQRKSKRSGWKIEVLNNGESPFEGNEPGLAELIARVVAKGSFKVTDDVDVLNDADIILIDVQTPTDEQHMPQYLSLRTYASISVTSRSLCEYREANEEGRNGCCRINSSTRYH
ncbi:MAG: hypothetical protein ACXADL_14510, partial [Candidatus Thorarchaeota archaeon]|jgi:UDP-N-acetyl-D-mannosaminuronic acid dehydrogenase